MKELPRNSRAATTLMGASVGIGIGLGIAVASSIDSWLYSEIAAALIAGAAAFAIYRVGIRFVDTKS